MGHLLGGGGQSFAKLPQKQDKKILSIKGEKQLLRPWTSHRPSIDIESIFRPLHDKKCTSECNELNAWKCAPNWIRRLWLQRTTAAIT